MRKKVMSLAWALIKATNNTINDLSTALRLAWKRVKLTAAIAAGRVQVEFAKADGEVTNRTTAQSDSTGSNPMVVLFSDLSNDGAIRSLRLDRLISWSAL